MSICMMCLLITLSSKAANTILVLKNTASDNVTTEIMKLKVLNEKSNESKLRKAPLAWWCVLMNVNRVNMGQGVDGTSYTQTTYTYSCIYYSIAQK